MSGQQVEKLKQMLKDAYDIYEGLSTEEKAVIDDYMEDQLEQKGDE